MCVIIETMIKDQLIVLLEKVLESVGLSYNEIQISKPAQEAFGDYSSSIALQLAKKERKNPIELAQQIVDSLPPSELISRVDVVKPGFINFWIAHTALIDNATEIINHKDLYGSNDSHKNKKVIVEFSSPNIAKPFTVGHLRSTIIGNAVSNLLEATGYTVLKDNHLGDWGSQFGKQIYALHHLGEGSLEANIQKIESSENPVKELVALYVAFHEKAEENPELEEEGRKWFKKLEDGNQEARELWGKCIEWSWKEFDKIYNKLGVTFTENDGQGYGESFFEDKMDDVLKELETKDFYKESKGAKLVFFPDDKYPPLMIIKQDGATLYSTRDLATDKFRLDTYGRDITIINEVGAEQSLYFQQLFETEKMLGWVTEGQRIHVKHGLYRFKDSKMSTRKGNTIWLEDVLDEAVKRAWQASNHQTEFGIDYAETKSLKHSDAAKDKHRLKTAERMNTSELIGVGALIWNDLKRSSHLDVVFDWDEILNMQGNSGPYIQYTYVRCTSVLDKAKEHNISFTSQDYEYNEDELAVLRQLIKFPETVSEAAHNYAPHLVCNYLFDLAQKYNLFYHNNQILKSKDEEKVLRILLTKATAQVLQNGLQLLGIKTVQKM